MSDLPEGWQFVSLGEIGTVQSGVGFPNEHQGLTSGDYPVYKVGDVSRGVTQNKGKLQSANNYVSTEISKLLKGQVFEAGSTLFAKIGEALKLNRRGFVIRPGLADNNVMGYTSLQDINNRFIYYFLCTQDFAEYSRSTTVPSIRKGDIEEIKIALPPATEQTRIAQKLDELLAQVDTLKARIDAIPALLKRFRQSVLTAAVSGRLTEEWRMQHVGWVNEVNPTAVPNHGDDCRVSQAPPNLPDNHTALVLASREQGEIPNGWQWRMLVNLAKLESGHTPRKSIAAYWENGDVPWLSLQDIRAADGKEIHQTKHMPTMLGIDNSSARLLPEGTVCFCRDISVGYVTIMGKSMSTTQHFANWICKEELIPKYLMFAFMASREHLTRSGQGSTVKTIYMPALKELRLSLPPLAEQTEIVRRVEQLFALADQLEAKVASAKSRIDHLTQSILAKAFRGELVPQDPNDEPASVLLERIQTQRASAPKAKRGRKASA